MPSTLVTVAAQAARSSAENARDSPEGLRPTAKIVAVCAKVDGIGPEPPRIANAYSFVFLAKFFVGSWSTLSRLELGADEGSIEIA